MGNKPRYTKMNGIRVAKSWEPETFGRLTTIGPWFLLPVSVRASGTTKREAVCVCMCECGNLLVASKHSLRTGNTQSCGCLSRSVLIDRNTKHGGSNTAEYEIWQGLKKRCRNSKSKDYHNYGGRGIRVCDRWQGDQGFQNFLEDMGPRPGPRYSIDRYPDKDGDYSPENCRWATDREQARNKRTNNIIALGGRILCISDWAVVAGIDRRTIQRRLQYGWLEAEAVTTPVRRKRQDDRR